MIQIFENRREAGRKLGTALKRYADREDVIVLGLPRGGVPVAYEVAEQLHAPLDVFVVRKLGVPGHEELAMGAVASGDTLILNNEVVQRLKISSQAIESVAHREREELNRRERLFRNDRPSPQLNDRCVVLVDDGLATGASMHAAIEAVKTHAPNRTVVAIPVAAPSTVELLRPLVDEIFSMQTPEHFYAVGQWYEDFSQTTDEEVRELLEQAYSRQTSSHP